MTYVGSSCPICHGKKSFSMKSVGVGITCIVLVGIIGFLFVNDTFEINEKNIDESIQNIPKKIQETTETVKDIATETSDKIQEPITAQIETVPKQESVNTFTEGETSEYHTTIDIIENRLTTLLSTERHSSSSTYFWEQIEGEPVKLSSYYVEKPTFMALEIPDGETKLLVFRLVVNDPNKGKFIDVITITVNPVPIVPKKSNDELVQYALEKINKDRTKNNLKPVLLSYNSAAQIHAEDVLAQRTISHWMSNGEKPYMTYTKMGGTGTVSQNVAFSGLTNPEECKKSNVICEKIDPFDSIERLEYGMMYDDAKSNWGHRDNILQPYHTHVSLGIAYDEYTFVFVENFEDNYLVSNTPISVVGNHVNIHSDLKSGKIQNISIFYDPLPTPQLYLQHRDDGHYELGENIGVVVPPLPANSYYNQPSGYKLIEADKWINEENSVLIDFDLSSIHTKPGVYTIGVWINEDGKDFGITTYSIFYK